MTLVKKEMQSVFDETLVKRGCAIRFCRKGDTTPRNGFVTEVRPKKLTALYCNTQNNACSYIDILASEVELGAWDIYLTEDFQTVYHEGDDV